MKKYIKHALFTGLLVSSLNANALLLAVQSINTECSTQTTSRYQKKCDQNWLYFSIGSGAAVAGSVAMAETAGITAAAFAASPAGALLLVGIVLDGNKIDAKSTVADPIKHLADLQQAGLYSDSEVLTIVNEIQGMKNQTEDKLARLGCQLDQPVCNSAKEDFEKAFGLSKVTVDFLAGLKGVQN